MAGLLPGSQNSGAAPSVFWGGQSRGGARRGWSNGLAAGGSRRAPALALEHAARHDETPPQLTRPNRTLDCFGPTRAACTNAAVMQETRVFCGFLFTCARHAVAAQARRTQRDKASLKLRNTDAREPTRAACVAPNLPHAVSPSLEKFAAASRKVGHASPVGSVYRNATAPSLVDGARARLHPPRSLRQARRSVSFPGARSPPRTATPRGNAVEAETGPSECDFATRGEIRKFRRRSRSQRLVKRSSEFFSLGVANRTRRGGCARAMPASISPSGRSSPRTDRSSE